MSTWKVKDSAGVIHSLECAASASGMAHAIGLYRTGAPEYCEASVASSAKLASITRITPAAGYSHTVLPSPDSQDELFWVYAPSSSSFSTAYLRTLNLNNNTFGTTNLVSVIRGFVRGMILGTSNYVVTYMGGVRSLYCRTRVGGVWGSATILYDKTVTGVTSSVNILKLNNGRSVIVALTPDGLSYWTVETDGTITGPTIVGSYTYENAVGSTVEPGTNKVILLVAPTTNNRIAYKHELTFSATPGSSHTGLTTNSITYKYTPPTLTTSIYMSWDSNNNMTVTQWNYAPPNYTPYLYTIISNVMVGPIRMPTTTDFPPNLVKALGPFSSTKNAYYYAKYISTTACDLYKVQDSIKESYGIRVFDGTDYLTAFNPSGALA